MALVVLLCLSFIFTLCLGFSIEASTLPQESNIGVSAYSIWPLFWTTVISGSFGGFVHALESEKTHAMKVPFDGRLADSGIWGHVFIGGCGSIVAVAVMIAIFGLDITAIASNPTSEESFVNSLKTM
ncbi:hypothetical protein, partial [Shewanella sp.]|uniref:hypothetical protein n=1 Tax=Shewanella sp. TaxID=50422 RepID=UPI003F2F9BDF